MTAAAQDLKSDQLGTPGEVAPRLLTFPVAASTTIYAGTMAALNAAGNAVPASAIGALVIVGRCERQVTQGVTAGPTYPALQVRQGVFFQANDTGAGAVAAANLFRTPVYAKDDNTVSLSDLAGTRPLAGFAVAIGVTGEETGKIAVFLGQGSPYFANPELANTSTAFRARNVAAAGNVASLAAFTVAGNDGVTNVAGDVVMLLEQTTTAQNGPYVVGTVAAGAAPLTRPDWFPAGSTAKSGTAIRVGGEGTVLKNTTFRAFVAADSFVVDTTDGKFYPTEVTGASTLVAGTATISTVPIFSANSAVHIERKVANTSALTVGGYHPTTGGATGVTAGVRGTGAVIIEACVGAGTINVADVSTVHWTIINQP